MDVKKSITKVSVSVWLGVLTLVVSILTLVLVVQGNRINTEALSIQKEINAAREENLRVMFTPLDQDYNTRIMHNNETGYTALLTKWVLKLHNKSDRRVTIDACYLYTQLDQYKYARNIYKTLTQRERGGIIPFDIEPGGNEYIEEVVPIEMDENAFNLAKTIVDIESEFSFDQFVKQFQIAQRDMCPQNLNEPMKVGACVRLLRHWRHGVEIRTAGGRTYDFNWGLNL